MALHDDLRAWVERAIGGAARVAGAAPLGVGHGVPLRVDLAGGGSLTCAVLRTGDAADEHDRRRLATEAAALAAAGAHGIPAPALIAADLDGSDAGLLAVLSTLVPGTTAIPVEPPRGRLRRLGAAAARLSEVALTPTEHLPPRERSIDDVDFPAIWRERRPGPLIERVMRHVESAGAPPGPVGLVHGDLWQGNALDDGQRLTGLIDWDCAGVGPAGIDIGTLRCDAAVCFGLEAADEIVAGWAEAAGAPPEGVDHWDVMAGLCSPPRWDPWVPLLHAQGRADVDSDLATARRDAFLTAALDRLGVP